MVLCAAAFAGTVWALMGRGGSAWGAEGLIVANCVNLGMRTALSSMFIARYFAEARRAHSGGGGGADEACRTLEAGRWMPRWATTGAFACGGWVVRRSERRWEEAVLRKGAGGGLRSTAEHVAVGAVVGLGCVAVMCVAFPLSLPPSFDLSSASSRC